MTTEREDTHREQIVHLLGQVDRRIRRNDALETLALGAWGFVGLLVLLKLTGGWEHVSVRVGILVAGVAAFIGFVVWRYQLASSLFRSAAVADRRADLKDSLKSALSFLGLAERTEWMALQIDRSAQAAVELDPEDLAPTIVPNRLYYASGAGVALFALLSWDPGWLQELERTPFLTASQEGQVEQIEELLDDVQALAPEEEKLEELSDALDRLRRRDIELAESLQELSEAQEALAASSADLERLEMDLEQLGKQLESAPALSDLSDALKSQNAAEAAELLRELAERLSDAETSEELQALLDSLQNADVQNQELADLMENLENAAGDMSAQDIAQMAEALEAMAEQLESMGQQMAAQQNMEQMGEELQQLEASLGQQQSGEQQQQSGEQQQASGQAMQSQAGMMSNQMQMAQMQGDPSSAMPVDAGPAGDTTGPGGGGDDEVMGEATTLDVQLEMEVLSPPEELEPVPEEIFERLSREEKSTLNYEDVGGRASYAEESAMQRESVPWQYRSLVKRYFLSIVTNAESTAEP